MKQGTQKKPMKFDSITSLTNVRDFHPSYFAMVMATGIVSIAFETLAFPGIAKALFTLNLALYLLFCLMLGARALFFPWALMTELRTLARSWLFLAFVVGTNTVGMQIVTFSQATSLATALWCVALLAWLILIAIIILNAIALPRESVVKSVNGATLLVIVSTVSVALLGSRLLDPGGENVRGFLALWGLWALGLMLYLFIIYWIIRRLFFNHFSVEDWQPAYWICMGAPAIITLAGSEFAIRLPGTLRDGIEQLTLGMSFFAWAAGTVWIPYLLVMDARKLAGGADSPPRWVKIFPWSRLAFGGRYQAYDPTAWSRVFPMGMYTACTLFLAKATGYRFLEHISSYWCWFALLIWSLTLVGASCSLMKSRIDR